MKTKGQYQEQQQTELKAARQKKEGWKEGNKDVKMEERERGKEAAGREERWAVRRKEEKKAVGREVGKEGSRTKGGRKDGRREVRKTRREDR